MSSLIGPRHRGHVGARVPSTEYTINYKDGSVTFSDTFGSQNASGNFRYFYKAQGEWALSIQKAPNQYRRNPAPDVGYAQFYIPLQPADPGTKSRMYFPLIDAGKNFDLLVVPGADHGISGPHSAYAQRRTREFFVRHLLAPTAVTAVRAQASK